MRISSQPASLSLIAVALAVSALPQPLAALPYNWRGGTGDYNDRFNWTVLGLPGLGFPDENDDVRILNPGSVVNVYRAGGDWLYGRHSFGSLLVGAQARMNVWTGLVAYGDITNNGVIFFGENADLYLNAPGPGLSYYTIGGTGTLLFGNNYNTVRTTSVNPSEWDGRVVLTIGPEQTLRGTNLIRNVALVNEGVINANPFNIIRAGAIGGGGTLQIDSAGTLQLNRPSSAGRLINNGSLELNSDIVVTNDYQNAYFGSGNSFNRRSGVSGLGQINAANAGQIVSGSALAGNTITFAPMRVGDPSSIAFLTVSNSGTQTTLRGAVRNLSAPSVSVANPNFALLPGASHNFALSFNSSLAGLRFESINVVNNFDNVADNFLIAMANVYAPAVATLSGTTVDFGTVRQGTPPVFAGITINNTAIGALTDRLVTGIGALPGHVAAAYLPAPIGNWASAAIFEPDTGSAGLVSGSATLSFTSRNPEMADLALPSQTIDFAGTVTAPAVAELAKHGGAGVFSGAGGLYTLDLGSFQAGAGAVGTELAVLNTVLGSAFSETLGGSFMLTGDLGYGFAGEPFSGLAGGGSAIGNWLTFDPGALAAGTYSGALTFNGYSRYAGLDDLVLAPIRVNFSATVTAIPEPATWVMLLTGFGAAGAAMRRRGPARPAAAACLVA